MGITLFVGVGAVCGPSGMTDLASRVAPLRERAGVGVGDQWGRGPAGGVPGGGHGLGKGLDVAPMGTGEQVGPAEG